MKKGFIKQKSRFVMERPMNQSLTVEISVFIYLTVIILLLFLSLFLLGIVGHTSEQRLSEEYSKLLRAAILMVNSRQQYMIDVADYYTLSPDVKNMIDIGNSGLPAATILDGSRFKAPTIIILSTVFYNIEGEAVCYTTKDTSWAPINQKNNDAFQEPASRRATYVQDYIDHNNSDFMRYDFSSKLCLWRVVWGNSDVHMIGAVTVTIDSRSLLGLDETAKQLSENLAIVNSGNQVVYNRFDTDLNEDDTCPLSNNSSGSDAGLYAADLNSGKYRVSCQVIPSTDSMAFSFYCHTPFAFGIDVAYSYILAGLFLYILSLFLSVIPVSKIITRPLVGLTKSIQQFTEGQQSVKVQFKYMGGISFLGKAFNNMILDNERLRISEHDLRLKNKDARLALIQTQINPHSPYNMLSAIQWQALKSGNKEVADIAYSMAQVFRVSLSRGRSTILVKQELDLVNYYLPLQKYRLGKKIDHRIDFGGGVLDHRIPKLILQPLVENSIVHGMTEDSFLNLVIFLSVALSEDGRSLYFTIQDNGYGISPEILRYLPNEVIPTAAGQDQRPNKSSRLVVKNIYDRLTLVYGSDFTFRIHGEQGISIEIILPVKGIDERNTSNAQIGDY